MTQGNPAYPSTGAMDTPVLVPGWTVQSGASGTNPGSDQSLVANAGPSGALVTPQAAPAPTSGGTGDTTYTPGQITDIINDLAAVVSALVAAGVFTS